MSHVAQLVYLMAPAYAANMAPPFVRFWHGWNRAISTRWLGSHKTVLGAVAGVVTALVVAFVQAQVAWSGSLLNYEHWPMLGALFGVGAMGGDMAKSFVKRRRGIRAGARWLPADQLDFAIGALILIQPIARLSLSDVALIITITFVGDIVVNHISFWLGVRNTAW